MKRGAALSLGGRQRRLNRTMIVSGALGYMDEHGVEALTMRVLGQELGVEAMSIYRYVSGREDLLEAVVARLTKGLHSGLESDANTSWQGYIHDFAYRVRAVALAHPAVFPLMATAHPATPWLRPPLRSVEVVEDFLLTLLKFGLHEKEAVEVYRLFTGFLLGHLLLESVVRRVNAASRTTIQETTPLPPTVRRLRVPLGEDHAEATFEGGLVALVHRLEASVA